MLGINLRSFLRMALWALFWGLALWFLPGLFQAHAYETATVTSEMAVVYADVDLSAPIGRIKRGKEIPIADIIRKNGTVVPTVVAGRLAYVKAADIDVEDPILKKRLDKEGKKIKEHNYYHLQGYEPEEDFKLNNFISADIRNFDAGPQWKELSEVSGNDKNIISGIRAGYEHRPTVSNYSFGVGLGYYQVAGTEYKFRTVASDLEVQYKLLKNKIINVGLGASLLLSGDARIAMQSRKEESKGVMWGYALSAEAEILPQSWLGIYIGLTTVHMNLSGVNTVRYPNSNEYHSVDKMGGAGGYIGVAYKM